MKWKNKGLGDENDTTERFNIIIFSCLNRPSWQPGHPPRITWFSALFTFVLYIFLMLSRSILVDLTKNRFVAFVFSCHVQVEVETRLQLTPFTEKGS